MKQCHHEQDLMKVVQLDHVHFAAGVEPSRTDISRASKNLGLVASLLFSAYDVLWSKLFDWLTVSQLCPAH